MKGKVPEEEYALPFGKAEIGREGSDVTVVALSRWVHEVRTVAENLSKEGISVEIVDPRTLVPMDLETIRSSVAKTGRLVVVDEACRTCSAAAEIITSIVEDPQIFQSLKAPPKRVCAHNVPVPYSPPLEKFALPDQEKIKAAVRGALGL